MTVLDFLHRNINCKGIYQKIQEQPTMDVWKCEGCGAVAYRGKQA